MTGPVSGSFIHWVLFSGFSSMSSNAVGRRRAAGGPRPTRGGGSSPSSSFQVSGDREPPRPPPRASHLLRGRWRGHCWGGDTPTFPGAGTLESIVATATRNLKIVTARDSVTPLQAHPDRKDLCKDDVASLISNWKNQTAQSSVNDLKKQKQKQHIKNEQFSAMKTVNF